MLPSHSDLIYFLKIAQLGNLTHAASHLGVSQPSLTLAMRRLENSVGVELFIRSRQGVRLTKAGERLLIETKKLMNHWEDIRQQALDSMNEVRGRFLLGCHVSVAHYSLPLFLPDLMAAHPSFEIGLVHDLSRHITQKVLDHDVDMGIVVNPIKHPDLVLKTLAKDVVTLWQSKGLENKDILICEPSLLQSQRIVSQLERKGLRFRRVIESSSLEVIRAMAECGCGVAILPTRVARAGGTSLSKVKEAPTFADEISLIYRTENRNVRALQVLSKAIQEGFAASER